jgi:hypothetical protein
MSAAKHVSKNSEHLPVDKLPGFAMRESVCEKSAPGQSAKAGNL